MVAVGICYDGCLRKPSTFLSRCELEGNAADLALSTDAIRSGRCLAIGIPAEEIGSPHRYTTLGTVTGDRSIEILAVCKWDVFGGSGQF